MAGTKITYLDKSNGDLVTSSDINEIKSVVNNNADELTAVQPNNLIVLSDTFSRTSIGADWTTFGSNITTSIVNNKLRLASTSVAAWGRVIYNNTLKSAYHDFEYIVYVNPVDTTVSNSALALRLADAGGRVHQFRLHSNGSVSIWYNAANPVTASSYLNFTDGDNLKMIVRRMDNKLSFQVINLSDENQEVSIDHTYPIDLSETTLEPNIFSFGFELLTGTFDIDSISVNNLNYKYNDLAFIGDSLTVGYNNITFDDLYYNQIKDRLNINVQIFAGGGLTTTNILSILPEVILANPKNVVLHIGQNDVLQAVPIGTIESNVDSIISQIETAGIKVFVCTNIPNGAGDQRTLADYIRTTHTGKVIDLYSNFRNALGDSADANMLVSAHWTTTGNDKLAEVMGNKLIEIGLA